MSCATSSTLIDGLADRASAEAACISSIGRGLGLLVVIALTNGCAYLLPETTPFGAVTGIDARRSINGLAVHQRMWQQAGARCMTPKMLSPRLEEDYDVIVLVGQSYAPPGVAARNWLEDWLAAGEQRSVVYFGRDFDADAYYRRQTLEQLPPEKYRRGEVELARAEVNQLNLRLRQVPEDAFCRWFYLDSDALTRDYRSFSGPWAGELDQLAGSWPVGVTLLPPDAKQKQSRPSWLAQSSSTNKTSPGNPLPNTAADARANQEDEQAEPPIQRDRWRIDELQSIQAWEAEFELVAQVEELLAGADGRPLIYRLTSERFGDGQILVAVNGAPFLNGSLVDPLHRAVSSRLINACLPARRVAFLAYDDSGILIVNSEENSARVAGLEVLTVWPLSAITMPALLLGVLVCIALFPILGRAQKAPQRSVSDFGLHIDALGRMLLQSRDAGYAQRVIAEYYERVRDEPPPSWLKTVAGVQQKSEVTGAAARYLPGEETQSAAANEFRMTSEAGSNEKHQRAV